MKLKLLFFGILADVTGFTSMELVTDIVDVGSLNTYLNSEYPGLAKYNYKIAVNGEFITHENKPENGDEIAFLPPFAGTALPPKPARLGSQCRLPGRLQAQATQ